MQNRIMMTTDKQAKKKKFRNNYIKMFFTLYFCVLCIFSKVHLSSQYLF